MLLNPPKEFNKWLVIITKEITINFIQVEGAICGISLTEKPGMTYDPNLKL